MTRSTSDISIEEVLRQLGRMSEDGPSGSSSQDAALNSLLTSIANNSIASQAYGIPMNTGSRGPVDASGLLTMSAAQEQQILNQRAADRGMEVLPGDDIGPTKELGIEDSIFQILMETIIGEQGIPEGVSAEAIEAIRGDFGPTTAPEELQEIAIDIAEAGGFDEWLAQQDLEGPPEELPTELEEEVDIDADTTLEDEIGVEPDMPIDIPFPTLPPREDEGNGDGDAEDNGEGTGNGNGAAGQEGQDDDGDIPDYSDIGDPDYGYPDGLPRQGEGGTIYDIRVDEPGFNVGLGIPVLGSLGGGGGDGVSGSGVAQRQGMFDPRFTPYRTSIGYAPVAVPQLIGPVKKDYDVALDGLFGRLLG